MILLAVNQDYLKEKKLAKAWFEEITQATSGCLNLKKNYFVSLAFIDQKKIKMLNNKYRLKNQVTDVLAFSYQETDQEAPDRTYLGEIFICYPQAEKQALEHRQPVEEEIKTLLIHGLLHLFGHDHATEADHRKMKKLEDKIRKINLN
ncbi:MAG TPA: rRNA maturation RNase YbeY [Patescibacteria group bacterium]